MELFDILLIKDHININQYNIAIQRHIYKRNFENNEEADNEFIDFIIDNPFNQPYSSIKTTEISFDDFNEFTSRNELSMFQLSYCMVKLRINSTLLIPYCIRTEPFHLRQNQIITIGHITMKEEDVYKSKCKRCKYDGSNVSIGFNFNLFKSYVTNT